MNEMNNNNTNAIEPRVLAQEVPPENTGPSIFEVIAGILRRWYIFMPIFIVINVVAVPAIMLLIEPVYTVQAAIKVESAQESILSGEVERGVGDTFMRTQSMIITSDPIRRKVVDKLIKKKLKFLQKPPFDPIDFLKEKLRGEKISLTPEQILKKAVADGIIIADLARGTDLIYVTMTGENASEAQQIVDAFVESYMAIEVVQALRIEEDKLKVLEEEKKAISKKVTNYRAAIMELGKQYGSLDLEPQQKMKLQRQSMLFSKVTEYEAIVLQLEVNVKVLKKKIEILEVAEESADPNEAQYVADIDDPDRNEYINADTTLNSLTSEVALYKRQLMAAALSFNPEHPEYKLRKKVLVLYQDEVDKRKEDVGKVYDSKKERQSAFKGKQELVNIRAILENAESSLELNESLKLQFEILLKNEDIATRDVGNIGLAIQDKKDLLRLEEEQGKLISRRIREMEMERKRPNRITVAYNADVVSKADKRIKLSLAAVFGSLAAGVGLAFLRTKVDQRLRKPADVSRSVDIRVIGTTTSIGSVKKSLMPGRIAEDFQTIRANLSVLNGNGGIAPGRLVITSPGSGEGKTTLAINLATSMAKSGKRVLLIDGDMRSPGIAKLLGLPKGSRGLQDLLFGADCQEAVCSMPSTGLDVLTCDDRNCSDAFELLTSPLTGQYIDAIAKKYDHVIIDTPPLLAFPDAMIWARMSDAVVLSCFIGKTTTQQMKLAKERLSQVGVNLLGTILSNVPSEQGYYQYGYTGYGKTVSSRNAESLFIHMHKEDDEKIESIGFSE
ncbi:MAG: polysaccharide biosynthesis tyrosine autokinase [Planctomycetes bacterium]|nr:polysaccharide biosynthesis tyrosine autokinase [Planctomycetota bacterium]